MMSCKKISIHSAVSKGVLGSNAALHFSPHEGKCSWTPTPTFSWCLNSSPLLSTPTSWSWLGIGNIRHWCLQYPPDVSFFKLKEDWLVCLSWLSATQQTEKPLVRLRLGHMSGLQVSVSSGGAYRRWWTIGVSHPLLLSPFPSKIKNILKIK